MNEDEMHRKIEDEYQELFFRHERENQNDIDFSKKRSHRYMAFREHLRTCGKEVKS